MDKKGRVLLETLLYRSSLLSLTTYDQEPLDVWDKDVGPLETTLETSRE